MREHIYGPDDIDIIWDPADPASVEEARATWRTYKTQGCYELYAPNAERLDAFDPTLGKSIVVRHIPPPDVVATWVRQHPDPRVDPRSRRGPPV